MSPPWYAAGMGNRERQTSAQTPAWAALPVDLWRQVALAASDACVFLDRQPAMPWLDGMRVIAAMGTVSRSMRDAVTGPGAARWTKSWHAMLPA